MKTRGSWRSRNPILAKLAAVAIAAWLVVWPTYGVLRDDFVIPIRYGQGRYQHFHGMAAWLMFAGFACVAASILVMVLLRSKTKPDSEAGEYVAASMAMLGMFVIMTMSALKMVGLL